MQSMKSAVAVFEGVAFFGCAIAGVACATVTNPLPAGCILIAFAIVFGCCLVARAILAAREPQS